MSNITLNPNASGTGTFSVASPNSNTDRTLTLPDSDGELVSLDSSGNFTVKGGDVTFYEDTGTTPKFFWDASAESLGIGGSPTDLGGQNYLSVHSPGTSTNIAGVDLYVSGTREASLISYPNNSEALRIAGLTNRPVTFHANNSEAMRITSSGDLLVNTTGLPDGSTYFGGSLNAGSLDRTQLRLAINTTSGPATLAAFYNANGQVGQIAVQGSATTYSTSSDYRLKENVVAMTGAVDRLNQLNPSRFNFIADADTVVDGFIAHEVQQVVPEAVVGAKDAVEAWTQDEIDAGDAPANTSAGDNKLDDDGNTIPVYQGIDQSKLVPLLTAALQEALTKIDDMETRLAALEAV